jgi:hypothetical protein
METENGKDIMAPEAELGPRPCNPCMTDGRIRSMTLRPTVPAPRSGCGHRAWRGCGGSAPASEPVIEAW